VQEIADWLNKLGMSEYIQRFAENRIDFSVLPDLTDQDLEKMGVVLGDRRKILRAVTALTDSGRAAQRTAAPADGTPAVRPLDAAERRQVTVMFSDLVGSTALSARLDPEDLREVISSYQKCVAGIVQRFGGYVAKYMGDGVLVYFGYPQAHEDDAERAVRAGLELVQAVAGLKSSAPLQTRVGIATGLVVVGDLIGSGVAQEQSVVGETPNLAARLQGLAEPNSVVIAESTRRLLGNLFDLEDLGAKDLKGVSGPAHAWAALRPSSVESRFEALRTATTPLVGREEEVDLLLRRWEQAKAGDGSVVLISGEPGIGKSRIAQTIGERLSGEPHTRLRYFCSPHQQDSALYPSIAQLERAAGLRREDTPEQRLEKLEAVLAQGTNDLSQVVPLLADLLSIPTGDRYPPVDLTPQKRKEKTLHAQLGQVEGLAARQPVLMVWEDVHWSDPTTRESLDLLVDRVPSLRVLVVITFRPEFTPPWIGRPHVTMLTLNRLPRRQGAEMIAYVTGGRALPKEISEQIVDRTDGVPLFIEELTKTVIESGIVAEAGDHYAVAVPTAPLAIPTSLHASLLARLDSLAPTREVAQIGAALGRSFSYELISAVVEMPPQKLDGALEQLSNAQLIFRRGVPPDAEYTFKHALVQDAAYSTLLRSRRRQVHARIATTLESRFPEIAGAEPAVLAQHYTEAGLTDNAVSYRLKAGHLGIARSAMKEAVSQLKKGLDLLANLPSDTRRHQHELDLQIVLGQALMASQHYAAPEVGQTYARARQLCEQLDWPPQFVAVLNGQYTYQLCVPEDLNRALELANELLTFGETRNDKAILRAGHNARGNVYLWLGNFAAAREDFEQGLKLYAPANRASSNSAMDPRVAALTNLSGALSYLGYADQARERDREALMEADNFGHAFQRAHARVLFFCNWTLQPMRDTLQRAETVLALATEHGIPMFQVLATVVRGWCVASLGKPDERIKQLQECVTQWRSFGAEVGIPLFFTFLADAYGKAGRPEEGLKQIAEAARSIEVRNERVYEAEMHRIQGELFRSMQKVSAAEASFREAITVARWQSAKLFELRAAMSMARLWRDGGKRQEALDLLSPVYGWFTEGFDTHDLKEANALLDELSA
jgi:class 3 adenylate cyclase/tetratricopeptide (TPR) repeat protein